MAAVLDIPVAIAKAIAMTLYEAPLPLVLLGFFTIVLLVGVFVSEAIINRLSSIVTYLTTLSSLQASF